ncbi:MAG: rhamnulokinase [Chloroflexi bacterium]|nr:rhamnulokinase [Chloroflexota bacterium]MBV9899043.1 rhamnulokinase [Chloroflexota bacterium]
MAQSTSSPVERPLKLLALDLGAESGRAVVGSFNGSRLDLEEAHRFANVPVRMGGTLYWDFPRLFGDVLTGIRAAQQNGPVASVGVDGWGVDFGLLDSRGRLLANPIHYRDSRTEGIMQLATQRVKARDIYAQTGIQLMPINTLYQLLSMAEAHDPDLERADKLLMVPDLVHHFLCDSAVTEYTNASTTQCFDVAHNDWAYGLLADLNIPRHPFPDVVPPGTRLGPLRADVAEHVGGATQVVTPACHDTASAVVATPLDGSAAYLSSGTWSLIGLELPKPVLSDAAREGNLTNEGGVAGTIRLLKNVMGLWLVQEARRELSPDVSYAELTWQAAQEDSWTAFIDPDDERFLRPGDLFGKVRAFCEETRQRPPADGPGLVRVLLESLALKYAVILRQLRTISGRSIAAIRVVGGGSQNALLCQLTANACNVTVLAGPAEATSVGNLIVQAMALGEVASISEARALVAASWPATRYEPANDWSEAHQRFGEIVLSLPKIQGVF